jgi:hypothetical protein
VNEAFLRLFRPQDRTWEHRAPFFSVAAMQIRHILIDHARRRSVRPDGHAQPDGDDILARMGVEKAKNLVDPDDVLGLLE